ncbi:alanine racemase [Marinomonas sp. THO17]|uniref:diaminopimelate decarboxylase family protein n=1 Tax=Marinomonas sp. THO17 TaxID=3149048 RepID=UPI00336BFC65
MEINHLLKQVSTPAFVYCYDTLKKSKDNVQNAIDGLCTGNWIAYSYKTNPLLAPYLANLGCAMQVTSVQHLMEVTSFLSEEAIRNSFYCSGSLTAKDALEVIKSGIYIVVDSISQLAIIDKVSQSLDIKPRVLIRVDAGQSAIDSPFGTSGMLQGIDIKTLPKLLNNPYSNVRIVGIHNHFGSQVTSLDAWQENIRRIATIVCDLDYPLEILNLGGGTPINYDSMNVPNIEEIYEKSLITSLKSMKDIHPSLKIVVEPGRYIVGPCGFLVATATNLHSADNRQGANLDASLFASFQDRFLSNLSFQFPVLEPKADINSSSKTILRGSSPASIDYFGIYEHIPNVNLGDKIIFGMAGAYASSMGSGFSGVECPKEYVLRDLALEDISNDK